MSGVRGADHPTLDDWGVYGSTWTSFDGQDMKLKIGICEKCAQRCGHDLYSTEGVELAGKVTRVEYTVSDSRSVVVQGLRDPDLARLISLAPELRDIAQALVAKEDGVRRRARAVLKKFDEKVRVWGVHDTTVSGLDDDEWNDD